jgi:hypothetical protein
MALRRACWTPIEIDRSPGGMGQISVCVTYKGWP